MTENNDEKLQKQTGLLTATIGLLALAISAGVQAKTLVYCSEGSPEGFNPQLFTSGTTYDAKLSTAL